MPPAAVGQKRKRVGERQDGQRNKSSYKGKQRALQDGGEPTSIAGKLLVIRAAKKARTFEVQKLVRKIKSDKAKAEIPAGTSKLHTELEDILTTLKALDIESLASNAFQSKLRKDKSGLQDNVDVQTFFDSHPKRQTSDGSTHAKAENRVLASKVMVQCMQEVLDNLRERAGITPKTVSNQQNQAGNPPTDDKKPALTSENLAKAAQAAPKPGTSDYDETSSEEDSDEEGSGDTASHISAEESLPDDEFAGINAARSDRVNEGEDGESTSGASISSFPALDNSRLKSTRTSDKDTTKKQKMAESSPPTTSAFLPSLAAGYTLGDSDGSVYSDDEAADTKPARKNRRGQRARQAIWERKYGKNAKHVKKATEREMDTEEARQKAKAEKEIEHLKKTGRYVYGVESNLTKPAEGKTQRTWTAAVQSDTANDKMAAMLAAESDAKAKRQATSNTIHPSWEARKKAKEAQANLASAKPAGKKIVFD